MARSYSSIDTIPFNGWLVSNIIGSTPTAKSAGEKAADRPNGEDWLVIDPQKGPQFIDPEKVTLPVDYVVMEVSPTAWLDQFMQNIKISPYISLNATIRETYHKHEAKDFLLIAQSQQDDVDALLAAKPKQYMLLLERSFYKAMVVHSIGAIMNKEYGYKLAGFHKPDDYHKALKDPASDIYLKLMKVMKQAQIGLKDVEELKQAALSEGKECYEIIPLLDHYRRSELKGAVAASGVGIMSATAANGGALSR